MILEIQNQSLVFFLSLRESLLPTRIRHRCKGIWVGFIPMVLSPIGFIRFSHETFRFLLVSNCEFYFSKSKKRFLTRIWDPGENGSVSKEYRIRNRFCPDLTQSIFDEEEIRRWPLDFPVCILVYLGSQAVSMDVFSDLKKRLLWPDVKILNHPSMNVNLQFDESEEEFYFLLKIDVASTSSNWPSDFLDWVLVYLGTQVLSMAVTSDFKKSIWVIRQRRLPNDHSEPLPKYSNILISTQRQDTVLSSTTLSSHFKSKVMLKAFWSLSSKLIANNKYVKEGHNR